MNASLPAATELSQAVVDAAHRDEVAALQRELRLVNETLDVMQADRDDWREAWTALAARFADSEAALERARDLAVRAGAFDEPHADWRVPPELEGTLDAPRWSEPPVWGQPGVDGPEVTQRGLDVERDECR